MANLADSIARIMAAYRRLDAGQGRTQRRNARAEFVAALDASRRSIDRQYPNIAKQRHDAGPRRLQLAAQQAAILEKYPPPVTGGTP